MENLLKKLRKHFRKVLSKNCLLGIKGSKYKLAYSIPLGEYKGLLQSLNKDEIYELKKIFDECGQAESFINLMPNDFWFSVCCTNIKIFYSFSEEQLQKILNNTKFDIGKMYYSEELTEIERNIIIKLLNIEVLEEWILGFSEESVRKFSGFLIGERNEEIFQKISNISNLAIAKLVESTFFDNIVKKIFENVEKERIFPIYQEIKKENLYDVFVKSGYNLLDDADREIYTWFYENLLYKDKEKLLNYLLNEKKNKLELFNEEICRKLLNILLQ